MRTVHETEALRPSDPIPKSLQTSSKQKLKLILKNMAPDQDHESSAVSPNGLKNGVEANGFKSSYPPELGFSEEEEARGPKELYRLLRRQIHWAEEEGDALKKECEALEELEKKEWLEKEILLDQVIKNEISWHERRQKVLAGEAVLPPAGEIKVAASALGDSQSGVDEPVEDQREAAAVLASLHNG